MKFIKTSLLTGISTLVKVLSGFVINKVISIYIGPSGLATVGQFRDFLNIAMSIGTCGIQQGVVKYTSEYSNDKKKLQYLINTSIIIILVSSLVAGLIVFIFKHELSIYIFKDAVYENIFLLLSFNIALFSLNTLFISLLNGLQEIKKFVVANIVASILGLILTSSLVYLFNLNGALAALATNQSIVFVSTFFFLKSTGKLKTVSFDLHFPILRKLLSYSMMFIISAFTVPVVLLIIRRHLGEVLSWEEAGYWEAMWRLSNMYLLFLTTSFSVYLIPTFSKLSFDQLGSEVLRIWKYVIPLTILLGIIIYLLRDTIIFILFSESFAPMTKLFPFHLTGDVLKVASWVIGNIVIAKAMTKVFILSQIGWSCLFLFLSFFFIKLEGLRGVSTAYFISYVFHFIFMNVYFYKLLWSRKKV